MSFSKYISLVKSSIGNHQTNFEYDGKEISICALNRFSSFLYVNPFITISIVLLLPLTWYFEFIIAAAVVLVVPLVGFYISYLNLKNNK